MTDHPDLTESEAEIQKPCEEIDKLRTQVREAFRAGFLAWVGPANEREHDEAVRGEAEAWAEWSSTQE